MPRPSSLPAQRTEQRAPEGRLDGSVRTCVGCGKRGKPLEMARVVLVKGEAGVGEGYLGAGPAGGQLFVSLPPSLGEGPRPSGRGAHLHPARACVEGAEKRGLSRSFRREVRVARGALGAALGRRAITRAKQLLLQVSRQKAASAWSGGGSSAVNEKPGACGGELLVVARDAGSSLAGAPSDELARAIGEGRAVTLGTSEELGALIGQNHVSVLAVRHPHLARGLARACALAGSVAFEGLEVG